RCAAARHVHMTRGSRQWRFVSFGYLLDGSVTAVGPIDGIGVDGNIIGLILPGDDGRERAAAVRAQALHDLAAVGLGPVEVHAVERDTVRIAPPADHLHGVVAATLHRATKDAAGAGGPVDISAIASDVDDTLRALR